MPSLLEKGLITVGHMQKLLIGGLQCQKRGHENFKQVIRDCISPSNVLTKARIKDICIEGKCLHLYLPSHALKRTFNAVEE